MASETASSPGEAAADPESLPEAFREKLIQLRTMELSLRRVVLLAVAGVVVAGLLVAGRDLPVGRTVVSGAVVPRTDVSAPVLLGCVALQILSWGLALAGAMHAHWPLRALILALWTGAMLAVPFATLEVPGTTYLVGYPTLVGVLLVIAVVWQTAIGLWVFDRFHPGWTGRAHRHRFHPLTGIACLAATALIYALGWLSPSPLEVATVASEQYACLGWLIIGVLVVTGGDFAEWAEVAAGQVAGAVARRSPVLLAGATVAVSLAVVAWTLRTSHPQRVALAILEMVALVGTTLVLGRLLISRIPTELSPLTLISTTLGMLAPWLGAEIVLIPLALVLGDAGTFLALLGLPSRRVRRASATPPSNWSARPCTFPHPPTAPSRPCCYRSPSRWSSSLAGFRAWPLRGSSSRFCASGTCGASPSTPGWGRAAALACFPASPPVRRSPPSPSPAGWP
ncbi:MAG TPA: hypothetical protein VIA06_04520 [Candidatus Dormibacteraeota bacterium]|jgi:hypothetical protein|nr:hypothetical protein [Candidatus Dormibacteraeota bacterium]